MNLCVLLKQHWLFLSLLFLVTVVVRLLLFEFYVSNNNRSNYFADSSEYSQIAMNIAQGNGICMQAGTPQYYRVPGYPLFLAFGLRWFSFDMKSVLAFQVVVTSLITILVFLLSYTLWPNLIVAKAAALLSAMNGGMMLFSGAVASESVFLLFFLPFLILFLLALRGQQNGVVQRKIGTYMLLAGMFLGASSLIRAVGHYVLITVLVLIIMQKIPLRRKIGSSVMLFVGWCLLAAWWLVRNFLLTGYVFFHSLSGVHFLNFLTAPVVARAEQAPYDVTQRKLYKEWQACVVQQEAELHTNLNEYEKCCLAEKVSVSYLKKYPFVVVRHAALQWIKTCIEPYSVYLFSIDDPPGYSRYINSGFKEKLGTFIHPSPDVKKLRWFIYFELIWLVFSMLGLLLFLVGLLSSPFLRRSVIKVMPFVAILVGMTLACGFARMRLPVEPILIIFVVFGWAYAYVQIKKIKTVDFV
jgi:hypothetical protein